MSRFTGRAAVVTGAADGIGAATARRLAEEGARVLAVDVSRDGLDAVARGQRNLVTLVQDVATPDAAGEIVTCAEEAFGGLDFLVNNAGICPNSQVADMPDEVWRQVMSVNLDAVFQISRAAIPLLTASTQGRIVNIGSILSTLGGAGLAAYTASKHAVAGFSKALALELGSSGVTVNFVQPGAIVTGITRPAMVADPAFEAFWTGKSALKRMGHPEDIAAAIAFLVSEDAAFITGHGLVVDGGVLRNA